MGAASFPRLIAALVAAAALGACSLLVESGDLSGAPDALDGAAADRSTPSDEASAADAGSDTTLTADAPFDGSLPSAAVATRVASSTASSTRCVSTGER